MAWDGKNRREMQLTDDDIEAISDAVAKKMHPATCPLNERQREAVPELYNIFRDIGGGDLSKGIAVFRDLLRFLSNMQSKKNLVGSVALGVVVLGSATWLIGAALSGVWGAIAEKIATGRIVP
jgi:hypothetical protein